VAVQVRDDGLGFDPATVRPTSHGLSGMRHRVESAGGRLSITSRPGKGTLVSAVMPLARGVGEDTSEVPALTS
jgi:signal transduction histidine kinase